MKLLHITSSMDPRTGGPCQGVRNLAACISSLGHDVEVVCLDDPNSEYLSAETIKIHALGRGRGSWNYHPALPTWLNQNVRQFDAIIQNGIWQFPGFALYWATRKTDIPPCFIFPHGMLDPWFQRDPERSLKAVRNWIYWKLIQKHIIQNAMALLFTCAEEMRLARTTFRPYTPKREVVVGYGTNPPPEFHKGMETAFRQKCPGLIHQPYLLFLGRIHSKKGLALLIKAYAATYYKAIDDSDSHASKSNSKPSTIPLLVIAGPGLETPYGEEMRKLAAELCPADSVLWSGMLTGDAKWGALYGADAFILPSHQENFGIAVVEALACGIPVLISNQVNIWQEIAQDKAGLVDLDTLEGTVALLRQWETLSKEQKIVMKQSAKTCFEKHFTIICASQKLLETIQSTIAERHPLSPYQNAISTR